MRPVLTVVLAGLLASAPASGAAPAALTSAARSILGADQGVYVEAADGTVLLSQAAAQPVHPASVSKVPTTLALLRKLGPDYRFTTTFTAKGALVDGTLHGELDVASDGNPSLVDEDALLVATRLRQAGIGRIAGDLRVQGPLTFDWKPDNDGVSLRRALSGHAPDAAWQAVLALNVANTAALATPGVQFLPAGSEPSSPAAGERLQQLADGRPLVVHHSQPLLTLLKSLNDFSNNIFAPLAAAAGGAAAVESLARSVVPSDMRGEITLGDGAGEDPSNRLSPRAAVKLLRLLEQELAKSHHALYEILPVAGMDEGTLHARLAAPGEAGHVLGKTGTYGDYGASALIGAIPTVDRGTVYFAILNHNVPVPQARARQDAFVRALLAYLHSVPWNYRRDPRPAITRAEVSLVAR